MARLVYTSDLHGNLELYLAAGEAARSWEADAVILGGDLCPGTPSASATHLPQAQPKFLLSKLGPMIEAWKKTQPGLRVFAIPGNDDCQTVLPALEELATRGLLENLHQRALKLGDYTLMGLAFVPPTPFSIKDFERRDSAEDTRPRTQPTRCVVSTSQGFRVLDDFGAYLDSHLTIEEELARLPDSEPMHTLAVVHCPPYETHCDVLYDGQHIGSRALRRWIERRQPLLTLHGHVHESPKLSRRFCDHLGRTCVVNPGSDGRQPHLVFIDLNNLDALEHSIYGRQEV